MSAAFAGRVVTCDAYEEPDRHHARQLEGSRILVAGRRPSPIGLVESLRAEVRAWRQAGYPGVSAVTRELLGYWFEREAERTTAGTRFFFCQREAVETLVYAYEARDRLVVAETDELVRYALKLATGTGKTVVLALVIVWATLHSTRVPGSSLSRNFLVLVPNLTVKDRVSGRSRGDGLDPAGARSLYRLFDMVPPLWQKDFRPEVRVCNWQAVPLEGRRDDWLEEDLDAPGGLVPASVLWAWRRRSRQGPAAGLKRFLGPWQDLIVLNDEAHHAHGKRRSTADDAPVMLRWTALLQHLARLAAVRLVVDASATPWRADPGAAAPISGSPGRSKHAGQAIPFSWVISDFTVEDAWESGLVKVVRLPLGTVDLYSQTRGARDASAFMAGCGETLDAMIERWARAFTTWRARNEPVPAPVLLIVVQNTRQASWLFDHITGHHGLLANPDPADPRTWATLRVDRSVFDADRGLEGTLREMVATVGLPGAPGESVRCLIGVQMLSEGWDVRSITHIVGLRAFDSPLLVEQIVGRGLRLRNYDVLNLALDSRLPGAEESVEVVGIPFAGFAIPEPSDTIAAVPGARPVHPDPSKEAYRMVIANVRGWIPVTTAEGIHLHPLHGLPEAFDTKRMPTFRWAGLTAPGRKCHLNAVPCRDGREQALAGFLDHAADVERYVKNERLGLAIPCGRSLRHPPAFLARTDAGALWALDLEPSPAPEAIARWCERLGMRYRCVDPETLDSLTQSASGRPATLEMLLGDPVGGSPGPYPPG